ncbi:uncharacterized protein LOC131255924 [Magnolia sinica]|uniref:uncharacterized protein LOC131255924 n=1 Tax=Magnolia sinica TaxID=86752 RepID=UPI00265AE2F9|nr:uncharacterized protein LOC131255924 [Magnolia sinica]
MKESSRPSRQRKPPSVQKIKLLCSVNGSFLPRPASGKLRYVGGETRIVSVGRDIGISHLLSKISEFCPKHPSMSLKYRLPDSDEDGLTSDLPLVSIDTDDDVWCMIDEYDKVAEYMESARLRIFVCNFNGTMSGPEMPTGYMDSPEFQPESFLSRFSEGLAKDRFSFQNCDESVRTVRFPFQGYHSKQCPGVRKSNHVYLNRENIMPWNVGHGLVKSRLWPASCNNQLGREVFPLNYLVGNDGLSGHPPCRVKNIRMGANDFRNRRSGLHDIGNNQDSGFGQKPCYGGCCTGLKPRLNISNVGEGRLRQAHLGKISCGTHEHFVAGIGNMGVSRKGTRSLFDHENSRILRERVVPPSYGRTSASRFCGQNGLLEEFRNSKVHENCLYFYRAHRGLLEAKKQSNDLSYDSCLVHDVIKNPVPCFGATTSREDHRCNQNVAKCETQSSFMFNNPFSNALHFSKQCEVSSQYPIINADLCPPYDQKIQAGQLCETLEEAVKESSNDHDLQDKMSVVLSVHNLSLSSSTEVAPPTVCSSVSISDELGTDEYLLMCHQSATNTANISARDDVSPRCEMSPQFNQLDNMDNGAHSAGSLIEHLPEADTHKRDADYPNGTSDTSIKAATELGSSMKLSGPSSLAVAHVSFSSGKDLAHEEENQKSTLSSFNTEEKVVGESTSKLVAFYAHLATRELQTIKNSDLEEIRELGSGTYGTVFYGKWKGSDVAIKRIKPSCFSQDELGEDRLIADFWKEAHLLGQLHHPNVVAFYGVVTDGPSMNLATVTEYMVNGSLKQVLRRKDRTIDRRKRLIIAMDAAFGMEYLHEKNIVHFDLKSHNFLVNMRDPQKPVCKIGDLGLSKVKQKTLVSGGVRGTLPWMAPELLTSKSGMVTEKVDVYSFGIVMWELLTGEEPYTDMRSEEIIAGIIKGDLRPEIPNWCDPAWRSLMERCWSSDPDSRPSFSEIAKELRAISASMNIK